MTHSLHRTAFVEGLKEDYVLIFVTAVGVNRDEKGKEKMGEIWDIISRYYKKGVINFGNLSNSNSHRASFEDMKKSGSIANAVFKDRDALKACLKEIKDGNFGISIVVSGVYEDVNKISQEIGISPHSVAVSLGVHGETKRLPDAILLDITTMCGHHLVSSNLVKRVVEKIKEGRMTHQEAAVELSKQCECGIFNDHRAEKLLKRLISNA